MEASFKPRTTRIEGTTVEFSRRTNPEVNITVPDYLLCVNFNTIKNAFYAYSGAPERRGIRKVGYSHLISANHNIKGYTPDPADHVIFTITPDRLRYLALTTFEEDHFDLRTEGIPFFDPFIYQIACSVRDELCADMLGGSIMIESLTTMLGIHLLRKHSSLRQQSFEQRRKLAPHKLILITDYIHNHFNQEISLTELANLADMSPFHFSRCFKDATGQSPSQYITNKRIIFMQSELVNSRRSLAELSLAAGFGSQSHMSRVFKQNVGLSPGAFRKQHS